MEKTILITGIGGLTPRSIATIVRERHPKYHLIGCDVNPKAVGFFMTGLLDEFFVCPRCTDSTYFPWIEHLISKKNIDYAFVQPESEIIEWCSFYEKNGRYPCPTLIGNLKLCSSLRDKAIMADLLVDTKFIPKTIKVTQENPKYDEIINEIGFPCWIRATEGTGGLGSLCLDCIENYRSWLLINSKINEFTISEYLGGRHLANQMLYYEGEYVKGASLECVEYVMANIAPSHVTGNTHFGRFLNEDRINFFCNECIEYLEKKLGVLAHGVFSFDLKEDNKGDLKVTEINIRHMAYTGVMAKIGFDLIEDTVRIMEDEGIERVKKAPFYHFEKPYIFLRDVDIEPIILESEELFNKKFEENGETVK